MNIFLMIVAYVLIYIACSIGRKEELKFFSREYILQVILVTIGGTILFMLNGL